MSPARGIRLWVSWICQIIAAIILGQTLFFKFSGAPEPVWIFTQLGVEPWGRYLTAVLELIAVILLLIPQIASLGALLGLFLISGAICAHIFVLGIVLHPPNMPEGDGGSLFGMAVVVWICCAVVIWLRRTQLMGMCPCCGCKSTGAAESG